MSLRTSLGLAALFAVLALAATWAWDASGDQVSDVPLYHAYGERMAEGKVPYRDFEVEYPPGALPALVLPALVTSGENGFEWVFAALMAACGAAGLLVCARTLLALERSPRTQRFATLAVALSPVLLGAVLLTRFDLVPALAVGAATLALVRGRDRLGAVLLGAAVAVKLYPLVLVPLAAAWTWRRLGRRRALECLALTAGVVVLAYLPFLVVAPDGVGTSIGRQLGRPLQIETLAAGLLLVAHETTGMGLEWSSSHGSQNLDGAVAGTLAVLSSLLQVGALAGCWIAFARGPASRDRLVRFLALALVVFVAFGKVLSPQFLVWLLFAVPLVAGAAGRRAGVLYAAAAACTAIWFPALYWELVREFDPVSSWLVLLRGLLLTGVVVVLARDSGRDGGQLRKSSRDRDARGRTPIMR